MNKRKMAEAGLEAQINPKELARKMRGEQTIADIAAPSDDEEDGDFEPVPKRVRKQTDRFVDSKYCQHNSNTTAAANSSITIGSGEKLWAALNRGAHTAPERIQLTVAAEVAKASNKIQ